MSRLRMGTLAEGGLAGSGLAGSGLGGSYFTAGPAPAPRPCPAAEILLSVPFCGRFDEPGRGDCDPTQVDYSRYRGATPDQQRIEQVLHGLDLRQRDILHVGIGNSSLAQRFCSRCRRLDGVTLSPAEMDRAAALNLPNYRAWRVNKHSSLLPGVAAGPYDLIVDNNLASFACCGFHLLLMFTNYRLLLRRGGWILTDQQGMDWVISDGPWKLTFAGLCEIGGRLGMDVTKITETVYAMIKP